MRAPERSKAGFLDRDSSRGEQLGAGMRARSLQSSIRDQSAVEVAFRKEVGAHRSLRALSRAHRMGAEGTSIHPESSHPWTEVVSAVMEHELMRTKIRGASRGTHRTAYNILRHSQDKSSLSLPWQGGVMRLFRGSPWPKKIPARERVPDGSDARATGDLAREAMQTTVVSARTGRPLVGRNAGGKSRMAGSVKTRKMSEIDPLSIREGLKGTAPPWVSADCWEATRDWVRERPSGGGSTSRFHLGRIRAESRDARS